MKHPRIYSLSTVGLLKHYNQDYLIHPERTDFTGSNGAGKSIIADILQLIFISDYKLIEFGTDGLKQELRQPYTLPLNISDGYAFLNIETVPDQFITIGVCIPDRRTRKIKPFVITQDVDLLKSRQELTFSKDKLLTSQDFIKNNRFLDLDTLTKHLRDTYDLYLTRFTEKHEKELYYSFLFNKDILPINLSIETNLQAFAKIIQSFSKSKSLSIKKSRSLQEFLFEANEKEYEAIFEQYKSDLDRLLHQYKELDLYIYELKSKQDFLTRLKVTEKLKIETSELFYKTDVLYAHQQMQIVQKTCNGLLKEYQDLLKQEKELTTAMPQLEKLSIEAEQAVVACKESLAAFVDYRKAVELFQTVSDEITLIEDIKLPTLTETLDIEVDLEHYSTKDIVKRVAILSPLLEVYGSLNQMKEKVTEQAQAVRTYRNQLESEIQGYEDLLQLINLNKKDTLFSQILERGEKLSPAQEVFVNALTSVYWEKPLNPKTGDRYTNTLELFDEQNIETDEQDKGYWLKTGALHMFMPYSERKQLFDDPKRLKQVLESKKRELSDLVVSKRSELNELDRFEEGKSFNRANIKLTYELDQRLKDYTVYKDFELSVALIHDLQPRMNKLDAQKTSAAEAMAHHAKKIHLDPGKQDLDKLSELLNKALNDKETLSKQHYGRFIENQTLLKTLSNNSIPDKSKFLSDQDDDLTLKKSTYISKDIDAKKVIAGLKIELEDQEKVTEVFLKEKKSLFDQAKEDYSVAYLAIVNHFEETKDRKNMEINEQIEQKTFQFPILEHVLLGVKIKYTDQIADELTEANRSRFNMAEAIHEAILKIFVHTRDKYEEYRGIIRDLNTFFKGKKISRKYYFQLNFNPHPSFSIDWINKLQIQSASVSKPGELPFGSSVESFIEGFFKSITGYQQRMPLSSLLDPKTYFELEASLTDEYNKEIPGSTGETYAAIVLLGIGRLSKVQNAGKDGIKFIILEETASLDKTNFNTFPDLAEEFGYQIITMTPKPYGSDSSNGWYLHHLVPNIIETDINNDPISYFKTNDDETDLKTYLTALNR